MSIVACAPVTMNLIFCCGLRGRCGAVLCHARDMLRCGLYLYRLPVFGFVFCLLSPEPATGFCLCDPEKPAFTFLCTENWEIYKPNKKNPAENDTAKKFALCSFPAGFLPTPFRVVPTPDRTSGHAGCSFRYGEGSSQTGAPVRYIVKFVRNSGALQPNHRPGN